MFPSVALASTIASRDFSSCAATVVGYGNMGREYVKALQALGVRQIRVCSRSEGPLCQLKGTGVATLAGGFQRFDGVAKQDELGIIATPTAYLIAAAERLASLGFRRLLIEKPVSLHSADIEQLASQFEKMGVEAVCAYNRLAYPSFRELDGCVAAEGGITSCTYTFTEMIKPDWPQRFAPEDLARWGIANSLHVIGMAHGLVGLPASWKGHRAGSLPWHPAGSVFVGSGISERGVPFAYHADWGSTGRWSVEVNTPASSYRLCPLEKLFRRTTTSAADWEEMRLSVFAPEVKPGFVEQTAAMLDSDLHRCLPLMSLRAAAALTRFADKIFGYSNPEESSPG